MKKLSLLVVMFFVSATAYADVVEIIDPGVNTPRGFFTRAQQNDDDLDTRLKNIVDDVDATKIKEAALPDGAATDQELTDGLATKQDAATAFSGSWNDLSDVPAGFADGTDDGGGDGTIIAGADPTKAAVAEEADALSVGATVPESAIPAEIARDSELPDVSGKMDIATYDADTDNQIDDAAIPSAIARDSEVTSAVGGKLDTPTGTPTASTFACGDGTWKEVEGGTTIVAGTDPTKAASAEEADSLVTGFVLDDANIPAAIARDSELPDISGKLNTPTGTADATTFARGDGTWAVPPVSTITPDTTDNTKAAVAVKAETLDPEKVDGEEGMGYWYEEVGMSTDGIGLFGPLDCTGKLGLRFPNTITPGKLLQIGSSPTTETRDSVDYTVYPLEEVDPASGSANVDDTAFDVSWDGNTTDGATKNALYDKFVAMQAEIDNLTQTVIDAGIKIFDLVFGSPAVDSWHSTAPDITATASVTGTGNTVTGVEWELNGSASYVATDIAADDGAFDEASEAITLSGATWSAESFVQGQNTVDFQVFSDSDRSTDKTITFNFDDVPPVIVAGADSTHDGVATVTGTCTLTETNPGDPAVTWSATNVQEPTSGSCTGVYPNYSTPDLTPTGTSEITVTYAATDPAGNAAVGTDLEQVFTYQAAQAFDYYWDFEETGVPSVGTWVESGTVNYDDTSAPIAGAQSLSLTQDSTSTTVSFTEYSGTAYMCIPIRTTVDPAASIADIVMVLESSTAELYNIYRLDIEKWRIRNNATYQILTNPEIYPLNSISYLWIDVTPNSGAGDGSMTMRVSSDKNKPTSGGVTTGENTRTGGLCKITIQKIGACNFMVDDIRISSTEFTSIP